MIIYCYFQNKITLIKNPVIFLFPEPYKMILEVILTHHMESNSVN